MPLARIITRTAENVTAASDYLLSQGYTVETVSPEEFRISPAELELHLEKCRPAEALARAKRAVETQSGAPQIEPLPAPEPVLPQTPKIAIAYDIAGRPVEFADEAETLHQPNVESTATELVSLLSRVTAPVRGLLQRRAQQRALKLEAELARKREETRRKEELARERVRLEMERQREEVEAAERRRTEQIAAEEQAERRRQKQIAALQAVGITIKPGASPHVQAVDSTAAQEAPVQQVAIPRPRRRSDRQTRPPVVRRRPPSVISVRALAVGCVVGLLVVVGLAAFNSRRPAFPLSPDILMKDGYVKQDLPFGAAILTPPPPTSQVTTKKSPAIRSASRKPSASGSRRSQANPDDVVVRHFPAAAPKPQPSTANLKRNSDTD